MPVEPTATDALCPWSSSAVRVAAGVMLLMLSQQGCGVFSSGGLRVAEYSDFYLISTSSRRPKNAKDEEFRILSTDMFFGNLADMYLELPNGECYSLKDLPEGEVARFLSRDQSLPDSMPRYYKSDGDLLMSTTFAFRDGKLVSARFDGWSSINIPFSPNKEGPYVRLPITRETMLKVFGEPVKWSSYTPVGGA